MAAAESFYQTLRCILEKDQHAELQHILPTLRSILTAIWCSSLGLSNNGECLTLSAAIKEAATAQCTRNIPHLGVFVRSMSGAL